MSILEISVGIFSIVSNIAIVITMFYGIKKFKQDKLNVIADLEWRRKNETILFSYEILEKTDNLLSEIKNKFNNETINVSDLQKEENSELRHVIFKYLALMERLSVGLNTEVYDLDVYARICRSKTILAWKQLERVVELRRETSNNPNLYIEFETVAGKLKVWSPKQPVETRGSYNRIK